jgi:hypothetical protein
MTGRPVPIRLTPGQRAQAFDAATAKAAHVDAIGARSLFDADNDQHARNVLAYEAEIAAAVVTGLAWRGFRDIGECHDGDLEARTEVRHRRHAGAPLLIRPEDKVGRAYVLVTGADGVYDVRGWVYGRDVYVVGQWWADAPYRPCWRVPQRSLRPIAELTRERNTV